jgi:F-type H+-transporting ATPase subunit delta
MIDQDRGRMFPGIAEEYYRLASAVRSKVSAEIITAVPISDEALEKLGAQLRKLTKKDVYLRSRVDESLIGGVVVRVGDKVLDGSVRSKLAQLKKQMVG